MRGEAFFIPPLFSHFVHVGKNPGKLTMPNFDDAVYEGSEFAKISCFGKFQFG